MARQRRGSPGQIAMPVVPVQGQRPLQSLTPAPVVQAQIPGNQGVATAGIAAGANAVKGFFDRKHDTEQQARAHKNQLERDEERTRQEKSVVKFSDSLVSAREQKGRVWASRLNQLSHLDAIALSHFNKQKMTPDQMQAWIIERRTLLGEPIRIAEVVDQDVMAGVLQQGTEAGVTPDGDLNEKDVDRRRFLDAGGTSFNDAMAVTATNSLLVSVAERVQNTGGLALLDDRIGKWMHDTRSELDTYTGRVMTALFNMAGYSGKIDFSNPLSMYTGEGGGISTGWRVPHNGVKAWVSKREKEFPTNWESLWEFEWPSSTAPARRPILDIFDRMTPQGFPGENVIRDLLEFGGDVLVQNRGDGTDYDGYLRGAAPQPQQPEMGFEGPKPPMGMTRSIMQTIHRLPPEAAYVAAYALPMYAQLIAEEAQSTDIGPVKEELMLAAKAFSDLGGMLMTMHQGIGVPPQKAAIVRAINDIRNRAMEGASYADLEEDEAAVFRMVSEFKDDASQPMSYSKAIANFESTGPFSTAARAYDHPVYGGHPKPTPERLQEYNDLLDSLGAGPPGEPQAIPVSGEKSPPFSYPMWNR